MWLVPLASHLCYFGLSMSITKNPRTRANQYRSPRTVSRLMRLGWMYRRGFILLCAALFVWVGVSIPSLLGYATYEVSASYPRTIERPWGVAPSHTKQEERCLAQAIYYEAGNQSRAGKEAVALVILNRTNQPTYPRTICGVVHQSTMIDGKRVCQFSYHCLERYKPNPARWAESLQVAKKSLTNAFERNIIISVGQAQYFHARYVRPQWATTKLKVATIGDHIFYRDCQQKRCA